MAEAQSTAAAAPALRLANIGKRFGALVANDGISLDLHGGEVLALLGENGAGKSTLVSILFGHYTADSGSIEVHGVPLPPGQPKAALAAGIGMVHQHFTLADNLSVLDNVLLGTEPLWRPFSRRAAARAALDDAARRFGLQVAADARVGSLSVGERQRVEILKALVAFGRKTGARILILDEPTAVLTPHEAESLFDTLGRMVASGMAVIFISHKLDEVLRVSHRIAVLRAGRLVALRPAAGASKAELAALMVGRAVAPAVKQAQPPGAVVCTLAGRPALQLRAGEVLAVAGVAGNGQQALADLLCGEAPARAGSVLLDGRALAASPRAFVAAGVARIPEDRQAVGVVGAMAVWENAVLERYASPGFSRFGVLRRGAARAFAKRLVAAFDVRGGGIDARTQALSGGNMQKLILGRVLLEAASGGGGTAPRLIVAHQPTWGLDVGAVAAVHQRLLDACAAGSAVLLISEDLDEIFAVADRIAVLHGGVLGAPRPAAQWTLADIGLAMSGAGPGPGTGAQHAA